MGQAPRRPRIAAADQSALDDPPHWRQTLLRRHVRIRAPIITSTDVIDAPATVYIAVQTNAAGQPVATLTLPGNGPDNGQNVVGQTPAETTPASVPASSFAPPNPPNNQNTLQASLSPSQTPAPLPATSETGADGSLTTLLTATGTSIGPLRTLPSSASSTSSAAAAASSTLAGVAGGIKASEATTASTPIVAGAVVGAVGGITVLLLIVLVCMRWFKHRRRAQPVPGGSNDSAANLAGPAGPHGGGGSAAAGGFRLLPSQEKEVGGDGRRGIIPSPALFTDRPGMNRGVGPGATPQMQQGGGYMASSREAEDPNEISVIGRGPSPHYVPGARGFTGNRSAAPNMSEGPGGRPDSRNKLIPFPPLGEAHNHDHPDGHGGFMPSNYPLTGDEHQHGINSGDAGPYGTPGTGRLSDGSVTSLYRDSWPPKGQPGVRPLFMNSPVVGDASHGPGNGRLGSSGLWPGPGAAPTVPQHQAAMADMHDHGHHAVTTRDNGDMISPAGGNYPASSMPPLQAQVQNHLGDDDAAESLQRETLRPSPARTPRVHNAEPDVYPFPSGERASPHEERIGYSPPTGGAGLTAAAAGNGAGANSLERKQVGGRS